MTHRRQGFERLYALRNDMAPAEVQHTATADEADDFFARKALALQGLATARELDRATTGWHIRPIIRSIKVWRPTMAGVAPFILVVVDSDTNTFSVEGPMTDDTPWISAVVQAQGAGREVQCFSASPVEFDERGVLGRRMQRVPCGSIVHI